MQKLLTYIKQLILDFFFPIHCAGCRKEKIHCCEKCLAKIPKIQPFYKTTTPIACEDIFAATEHKENSAVTELIHRFKYDGSKEIADLLVKLFPYDLFGIAKNKKIALVPVPLHWRRKNWRGFNQSEILAYKIAENHNIEVKNLLQRHRYTQPQIELGKEKRMKNLIDAFSLKDPESHCDPDVAYFLVDDVITTGTTLNECAKILKKHGAEHVSGLVVARAV